MTLIIAISVGVCFAVSIYLMLGRELKGIAMGVFLLGHAANLSILAMSGSPVNPAEAVADSVPHDAAHASLAVKDTDITGVSSPEMKDPPILASTKPVADPLAQIVDPLPQALILTAIVISFGVMAFLLTLLVVTVRKTQTLEVGELAGDSPSAVEEVQAV